MSYGHGQRVCVGKYLVNDALFIGIVTVLWAVRFERQKDANGEEEYLDIVKYVSSNHLFHAGHADVTARCLCQTVPWFPEAATCQLKLVDFGASFSHYESRRQTLILSL
jgi:hypothetical protein